MKEVWRAMQLSVVAGVLSVSIAIAQTAPSRDDSGHSPASGSNRWSMWLTDERMLISLSEPPEQTVSFKQLTVYQNRISITLEIISGTEAAEVRDIVFPRVPHSSVLWNERDKSFEITFLDERPALSAEDTGIVLREKPAFVNTAFERGQEVSWGGGDAFVDGEGSTLFVDFRHNRGVVIPLPSNVDQVTMERRPAAKGYATIRWETGGYVQVGGEIFLFPEEDNKVLIYGADRSVTHIRIPSMLLERVANSHEEATSWPASIRREIQESLASPGTQAREDQGNQEK